MKIPHVLTAFGMIAASGLGSAAIVLAGGGTSTTVDTCVNQNGVPIVVEAGAKCGADTTPLSWNVTGPRGLTGATGPAGPAGPAGARGPSGDSGVVAANAGYGASIQLQRGRDTTVLDLTLPAGSFNVTGKTTIRNDRTTTSDDTRISCVLNGPYGTGRRNFDYSEIGVPEGNQETIVNQNFVTLERSGVVRLICRNYSSGQTLAGWRSLVAEPARLEF